MCSWDAQRECNEDFCWSNIKITGVAETSRTNGGVVLRHGRDMHENVLNDTVNWQTKKWSNITKFRIFIQTGRTWISRRSITSLPTNVLKCLYLARIGRPDNPWSVNNFARAVARWTQACDRRLARLISYIHHTNEFRQDFLHSSHKWSPTTLSCGKHCSALSIGFIPRLRLCWRPWGLEIDFGWSGSRTFVPINWMCKKQTSVSHSSTESENISLDAGLRMDGLPALDLWDVMIEVLHSLKNTRSPTQQAQGNLSRNSNTKLKKRGTRDVDELSIMDHVVTNVNSSQCEGQLYIFDDTEAVIKMIIRSGSPTMRHVSCTICSRSLGHGNWSVTFNAQHCKKR